MDGPAVLFIVWMTHIQSPDPIDLRLVAWEVDLCHRIFVGC